MAAPLRIAGVVRRALALCAGMAAGAALAAGAYDCQLPGGSDVLVVGSDIARRFPSIGSACAAASWAPAAEVPPPAWPALPVRVIHARAPRGAPEARRAGATGGGDGGSVAGISRRADALAPLIESAAQRHAVDPHLVRAVIQVESGYAPHARSPKGAIGLMQLMPATAARFGAATEEEILSPAVNVDVGVRYLRFLTDRFGGRTDLVLAAYNAGEGAVIRHGYRVPPYRETLDYVRKVLDLYPAPGG
ncbi:lytic transglycosylase domain-containing protein [Acidovorax sp. PRC11]|uniref:lytic transglycosylase domain-containing protein n=1 Tax=Acidovorax sp. PRC11 TaxID=2962592 RepID=UPI0028817351|nr:lytic transglycosylase domain-containing protein [Acidovorax sp. PRC11]MDT0139369.1 lytic transglycosylase domain-containing protein [Acidovorax sp. PRC11]